MTATTTQRSVLALNVGSSSLKFGIYLFDGSVPRHGLSGTVRKQGDTHWIESVVRDNQSSEPVDRTPRKGPLLRSLFELMAAHGWSKPLAIGHRVVHGGVALREHRLVDAQVLEQLDAACAFAPLHVPPALALIRQAMALEPGIANVACLDTAFHKDMPELAKVLPLPADIRHEGVQRFGFHGLSCESIVRQLGEALPARLIIAHLGSGASVTAARDGRSIDTSMGLTPTGGVIMGTRPGDLDPGVLMYLMRAHHYSAEKLEDLLDRHSGLAGISGMGGDAQQLVEAQERHPAAKLAMQQFVQSVARHIAGMAIALGGADLLVFTGGIGEHAPTVREAIMALLQPLLPSLASKVLPAMENDTIARHAMRLASKP